MGKQALDLVNIMRNVTGRVDATDPLFTNEIMLQYLNDFIVQISSQDIRIFKNYTWWEFDISPSTPNPYPVNLQDLGYTTIGGTAYVQNVSVPSPPSVTNVAMNGAINSSNTIFTLQALNFVVPGTFFITGTNPAQTLGDNGEGVLIGDGSGVIDYNTGLVSVVFNTAPTSGTVTASYDYSTSQISTNDLPQYSFLLWWFQSPLDFYAQWPDRITYPPQRPTSVLYYNNQLLFRGPPDQEYHIKIQAYREEIEFGPEGSIDSDYMFRYLAYGASLDIFSDYGEIDKWNEYYPIFKRYRALVYGRTNCQYQNQRPNPEF